MRSNFATKPAQSLLEATYDLSSLLLGLIRWSSRVTAPRRAESKRPGGAEHAGSDSEHRQVVPCDQKHSSHRKEAENKVWFIFFFFVLEAHSCEEEPPPV